MSVFKAFRQSLLVDAAHYQKRTGEDALLLDSTAKRQKVTGFKPTPGPKKKYVAPVLLQPSANGDFELDVIGYIDGRVKNRNFRKCMVNLMQDNGERVTVRGEFWMVDPHFIYRFRCKRTMEKNQVIFDIIRPLDPPMIPRNICVFDFKKVLGIKLGKTKEQAVEIVKQILSPVEQKQPPKTVFFTADSLYDRFRDEKWYKSLAECWAPLRYRNLRSLCHFWSFSSLESLTAFELLRLNELLETKPLVMMLRDCNQYGLNCIEPTDAHIAKLEEIFNKPVDPVVVKIARVYNRLHKEMEEMGCDSLKRGHLAKCPEIGWDDSGKILAAMVSPKYRLIVIRPEPGFIDETAKDFDERRYYLAPDWTARFVIRKRLREIVQGPPDELKIYHTFTLDSPSAEQQRAISSIRTEQNVLLLMGDAGTGKTETAKAIFRSFAPGTVRAVAAYGEPAAKQKEAFGDGMTIDLFLSKLRRETAHGRKLLANTQVLLIDEGGIVLTAKFGLLLQLLKNLKKVIIIGDNKQLTPIGSGYVLAPLVKKWNGTPFLQRLTRVYRNNEELVANFQNYLDGRLGEITWTNDLNSDNPMKLIQRNEMPPRLHFPTTDQEKQERLVFLMDEMKKIYDYLVDVDPRLEKTRILVQREKDADMLNEIIFRILNAYTIRKFSEYVFYPGEKVCFKRNISYPKPSWTKQIACSLTISTNRMAVIKEIYDINPRGPRATAFARRIPCDNTSVGKPNEGWYRVVLFEDGTQINLTDYSLFNIKRAYATTIASTIGSEIDRVVIYIHPAFTRKFFNRGILYTAMTRAKEEVILDMEIGNDVSLSKSDMAVIQSVPPPEPENTLVNYLPSYEDRLNKTPAPTYETVQQEGLLEFSLFARGGEDIEDDSSALSEAELDEESEDPSRVVLTTTFSRDVMELQGEF